MWLATAIVTTIPTKYDTNQNQNPLRICDTIRTVVPRYPKSKSTSFIAAAAAHYYQEFNIMSSVIIDISNDRDAADASLLGLPLPGGSSSSSNNNNKSILFFWAEWHAPSISGGPFDTVVKTLAQQNDGSVKFYRVLAEEAPKLSRKVC